MSFTRASTHWVRTGDVHIGGVGHSPKRFPILGMEITTGCQPRLQLSPGQHLWWHIRKCHGRVSINIEEGADSYQVHVL
jgi:hypothetical protein